MFTCPSRPTTRPSQFASSDRRWLRISRPFVFVGGELRPEDLDLAYDPALGYHQAPPHVKAHGGLLAIDDFGRQQVSPHALLNRWIAALERGEDTMALVTGERITFPFRSTIVFSTNLEPKSMLEEAHLRRIPYKIRIPEPTAAQMTEIFKRFAEAMGVEYTPETDGDVCAAGVPGERGPVPQLPPARRPPADHRGGAIRQARTRPRAGGRATRLRSLLRGGSRRVTRSAATGEKACAHLPGRERYDECHSQAPLC